MNTISIGDEFIRLEEGFLADGQVQHLENGLVHLAGTNIRSILDVIRCHLQKGYALFKLKDG